MNYLKEQQFVSIDPMCCVGNAGRLSAKHKSFLLKEILQCSLLVSDRNLLPRASNFKGCLQSIKAAFKSHEMVRV